MKKIFFLAALMSASLMASAAKYCDVPTGHENNADFDNANARILLTIEPTANANEFKLTIKPNYANGATQKLDYLYVIAGGNTPYPAEAGSDVDEGGSDELSVTFTNSNATTSFTIQWSNPGWDGRWQCTPADVPLSALVACDQPDACTDAIAPTISAVATSEVTHNSAVLTVTAADNEGGSGILRYIVKNGETQLKTSTSNTIELTGLTSNTEYNLNVYAEDECENVSEAFAVHFTTESFTYCEYPTGHLKDANFGNVNGRILLTIRKISTSSVGVTVEPNNGGVDVFDFVQVELSGAPTQTLGSVGGSTPTDTEIVFEGLSSLNFNINILWHNKTEANEGLRWTTQNIAVKEAELCTESTPTAIGEIETSANVQKMIENGQLIIIKNGVRYNVAGQVVK